MSDVRARAVERSHAVGADPIADEAARIAEHLRAGGRDPRVTPAKRDEVQRCRSRVSRWVTGLWPRALTAELVCEPIWGAAPPVVGLPRGTLVLSVGVWHSRRYPNGAYEPDEWDVWVHLLGGRLPSPLTAHATGNPERWSHFRAFDYPELTDGVPAGVDVEGVAWDWNQGGPKGNYREQRSSIEQWRRWAKGGTVLALGRAADLRAGHLDACTTEGLCAPGCPVTAP